MKRLITTVLMAIALTACSVAEVRLGYDMQYVLPLPGAQPIVDVGQVIDRRGRPPNWLGEIRDPSGKAIKTIETTDPVDEIIKAAFSDSLKAKQLLGTPGQATFVLTIVIEQFECDQQTQRAAHARGKATLIDTRNGVTRFSREFEVDELGEAVQRGIAGSALELQVLTRRMLQGMVDGILADPIFLAVVLRS